MKRLTHQLIPWLNFLLIIALLRSFLQPIPLAWASTPPPSLVPALRVGTPPERSGVPGGAKLDAGASSLRSNAGALERGEKSIALISNPKSEISNPKVNRRGVAP